MQSTYSLKKWIWSEADFEDMGWHDSTIHAIAFIPDTYEFALDIDYIFQWVEPVKNEKNYKFWVAPATLVFKNTYDLSLDLRTSSDLTILNMTRKNPTKPRNAEFLKKEIEWLWDIDCQEGNITFQSIGYKMYVKAKPVLQNATSLDARSRGINFIRRKM